ncbi:hypothetical protein L226DRAFT_379935 [Lentinus tigrinus ALCF2SS1-7]|uniref:uncharacterized protein n=1 Tax=Lentinus tigrinus ALCF2SS1-7 TaxID=1328758 RepID=UPI001165CDAB|nr:hypothetical protein L226DRAFT_379935 [Lentinus tigrinus ALCF2SS1-7]
MHHTNLRHTDPFRRILRWRRLTRRSVLLSLQIHSLYHPIPGPPGRSMRFAVTTPLFLTVALIRTQPYTHIDCTLNGTTGETHMTVKREAMCRFVTEVLHAYSMHRKRRPLHITVSM